MAVDVAVEAVADVGRGAARLVGVGSVRCEESLAGVGQGRQQSATDAVVMCDGEPVEGQLGAQAVAAQTL